VLRKSLDTYKKKIDANHNIESDHEKTIATIKQEFEKLVNDPTVFERGLIIRSFSFEIPGEVKSFLNNTHDYINGFSISLFLPFSEKEYAYFLVSHNFKELLTEEAKLIKSVEISNMDKLHLHLILLNINDPFISILFVVHPLPINFLEELKKCEKYLAHYQTFSTHVAVVNLVVKDFSIDFAYYEKVL
jgi:hypothetical protein